MIGMQQTYTLVFNQENLEQFYEDYFKRYPSRAKRHIDSPLVPSLNRWLALAPRARQPIKKCWVEYTRFILNQQGLHNVQLTACKVHIHFVFGTRRLSDLDNRTPKLLQDALTHCGFWIEDNYTVVQELRLTASYEKNNPQMIVTIYDLSDGNNLMGD